MESWQVNHINKHLVDLHKLTICNVQLFTFFKSNNVLSQEEIEQLERHGDLQNIKKASELYTIIKTRLKGYELLVKGLFELSQTGALKLLLEGYENQGTHNPFQLCDIQLDLEKILSAPVRFQKTESLLSNFCNKLENFEEFCLKYFGATDYLELVQKNVEYVLFANSAPNKVSYYIQRCVEKPNHNITLNADVFKSQCNDIFLIKGVTRPQLSKLAGPLSRTCVSSKQIWKSQLTVRFILLEADIDFKLLFLKTENPIHLIHCEGESYKLVRSQNGTIDSRFKQTSKPLILDEEQIVHYWINSFQTEHVLLSDTPGMGKTEFMASLANKIMELTKNHLVVFVKFDEFCKAMAWQTVSFTIIWEQILKIGCKSYFGKQVITELVKMKLYKTVLFIDGFDLVLPEHQELSSEILELINKNSLKFNIKIILSTRPDNREVIEKLYGFVFYALVPFKEDDRPECILSYWENELKLGRNSKMEKFAKMCLNVLEAKFNSTDQEPIAGLPLQCRLIADVYKDIVVECCQHQTEEDTEDMDMFNCTLVDLYDVFFSMRLEIFDSNKAENVRKAHYRYAVELLFPDWIGKLKVYFSNDVDEGDVLKAGILEKPLDSIRFVHRTFAEYLAAQLLLDILNDNDINQTDGVEFLLNTIFLTLGTSEKVYDKEVVSHKFIYPVVCCFINGFLSQSHHFYLKHILDVGLNRNVELCFETLCAAVLSNYFNLLRLIRTIFLSGNHDMILLQIMEIRIDWMDLGLLAAKYSDVELLDECLDLLEELPIEIPDTMWKSLVLATFQRGTYSNFEVAFNQYFDTYEDVQELSSLLRDCIRDSKSLEVTEQLEMLDFILECQDEQFILDLIDSQGNTVIFEQNIHVDILIHLTKKDVKLTTRINISGENIIHVVVKYLSSTELHRFITLPEIIDCLLRLLEMKNIYGDTAFRSLVIHLDPLEKTMELITSLSGFDISNFCNSSYPLMATAITYGRHKNLLKFLIKIGESMRSYVDKFSENEIHFALRAKNISAVELFLEQGVDLFGQNKDGETAWEYANRLFAYECVSKTFMFELRKLFNNHVGNPPESEEQFQMLTINVKEIKRKERPKQNQSNIVRPSGIIPKPDFYGSNFKSSLLSFADKLKSVKQINETTLFKYSAKSFSADSFGADSDGSASYNASGSQSDTQEITNVNFKTAITGMEKDIAKCSFPLGITSYLHQHFYLKLSRILLKRRESEIECMQHFDAMYRFLEFGEEIMHEKMMEKTLEEWSLKFPKEATFSRLLDVLESVNKGNFVAESIRSHYKLQTVKVQYQSLTSTQKSCAVPENTNHPKQRYNIKRRPTTKTRKTPPNIATNEHDTPNSSQNFNPKFLSNQKSGYPKGYFTKMKY